MTILHVSDFKIQELQPVSFTINNELVCLSGPSGTGKSLLLRALADLIVHQGEAYLDDKKCSDSNPVEWRQWVGLLPAESAWWMDKVGDHFKQKSHDYLRHQVTSGQGERGQGLLLSLSVAQAYVRHCP